MIITVNGRQYRVEGIKEVPPRDGILHLSGEVLKQIREKGHARMGSLYLVPVRKQAS